MTKAQTTSKMDCKLIFSPSNHLLKSLNFTLNLPHFPFKLCSLIILSILFIHYYDFLQTLVRWKFTSLLGISFWNNWEDFIVDMTVYTISSIIILPIFTIAIIAILVFLIIILHYVYILQLFITGKLHRLLKTI